MITEQQRTEAVKIFKQGEEERELIKDRPDWTQEDMEQSIERTIDSLKAIGISENQISGLYREAFSHRIFNSEAEKYTAEIASLLYREYPDTPKPKDLPAIFDLVETFKNYQLSHFKDLKLKLDSNARVDLDQCVQGLLIASNTVAGNLDQIADGTLANQKESLKTFWSHYVKHQGRLYGEVPAKLLGQMDLSKLKNLALTPSEQPIRKLEDALQRGKFTSNDISDYPIANISGSVGGEFIQVAAEIIPIDDEDREIALDIAAKLNSPLSNLGPKSQQAFAAILHIWLNRSKKEGDKKVTIHINELAEIMGFKRQDIGSYQQNALDTIRECIFALGRTQLTFAAPMPTVRGKMVQSNQPALNVEYYAQGVDIPPGGRVEQYWKAIRVSLNSFIQITADKGFIKGSDFKLNRLDSIRERAELYLGKYLENEWRVNWDKTPGIIRRRIYTLLKDGLGINVDNKIDRPRKVIEKLDNALEKLQELKTIKYFEYSPEYIDLLDNQRITPSILNKLLDVTVHIESGKKYQKHYSNHGLTHKGAKQLTDTITELKSYLSASNLSQAVVAEDLDISRKTLSSYLSGRSKPTAKNLDKIRTWLNNKGESLNLDLF